MPFGGRLRSDNRWVRLAKLIPWSKFESLYAETLAGTEMGCPAKNVRIALGSLIIKERLGTSDEETVAQIRENPYLQYFLGFHEYRDKTPFDPSMFVHFRKRLGADIVMNVNERVAQLACSQTSPTAPKRSDSEPPSSTDGGESIDSPPPPAVSPGAASDSGLCCEKETSDPDTGEPAEPTCANHGKLSVDATCAPADIAYPTDLNLLNEAREIAEQIIDVLHCPLKGSVRKPRTSRRKARKDDLSAAKARRLSAGKRRKAIGKQWRYVHRDLLPVQRLLKHEVVSLMLLSPRQYRTLLVIHELYRQQTQLFDTRCHRIEGRIVSISQPHIRPIVRGKANAPTEFGANVSAALIDGYAFIDKIGWENFNESTRRAEQIEEYRRRFGFSPKSVHADKISRTRDPRKYCRKRPIRMSGPPLGRPPKVTDENREQLEHQKQLARQDERDRVAIEGKFGQGKRRFGLGRVMAKLAVTSECAIAITFLVMNLEKWLRSLFSCLFLRILLGVIAPIHAIVTTISKSACTFKNISFGLCLQF